MSEITITCKAHGIDVSDGRCHKCFEENCSTIGPHFGNTVMVNGVEKPWYHGTTYLGSDIVPIELRDRINDFIEKEVAAYKARCQCALCQKAKTEAAELV